MGSLGLKVGKWGLTTTYGNEENPPHGKMKEDKKKKKRRGKVENHGIRKEPGMGLHRNTQKNPISKTGGRKGAKGAKRWGKIFTVKVLEERVLGVRLGKMGELETCESRSGSTAGGALGGGRNLTATLPVRRSPRGGNKGRLVRKSTRGGPGVFLRGEPNNELL